MIEIKNLTVGYPAKETDNVLKDVSLTIDGNTPCAIIGPSGCGKSTLLKSIAGLLDHQGEITFNGHPVDNKELTIGFVPQNYGLYPWKTVRDNIFLSAAVKNKAAEHYDELLHLLGLSGLENRYPSELSGGQQQRVSLARAFLTEPDILLMDEPFSALDIISREEMQELFLNVWNKYKVDAILVTHFVEEALYLAGQIIVMSDDPDTVKTIIDNQFFGKRELRSTAAFAAAADEMRTLLKKRGETVA